MKEDRLYYLAYDALLARWSAVYVLLNKNPNNAIIRHREHELWLELKELRVEMDSKGYNCII